MSLFSDFQLVAYLNTTASDLALYVESNLYSAFFNSSGYDACRSWLKMERRLMGLQEMHGY